MKMMFRRIAMTVLCAYLLIGSVFAKQLVPVGQVVGLELQNKQVVVAGFDEKQGAAARDAGLRDGDVIQKIDNVEISCAEDVRKALQQSDGMVTLQVSRNGKISQVKITPQITKDGPRLGLYLRQGITGIGTVTWYDPDTGKFGTLGHGVNDCNGNLLAMESGYVYRARVMAVKKGKIGEPGQLVGALESPEPAGTLTANTPQGVFGTSQNGWEKTALEVASAQEVKTGDAVIQSTISGDTVREYSVKIMKIYPKTRTTGRNLLLKVTDPALLEATGGIVQGMGVSYNRDNTGNPNSLRGFQVTDP